MNKNESFYRHHAGRLGIVMAFVFLVFAFSPAFVVMAPIGCILILIAIGARGSGRHWQRCLSDVLIGFPVMWMIWASLAPSTGLRHIVRDYRAQMYSDPNQAEDVCMHFEDMPKEDRCWNSPTLRNGLAGQASKQVVARIEYTFDLSKFHPLTIFDIQYMNLFSVDGEHVIDGVDYGHGGFRARQTEYGRPLPQRWWFW